MTVLENPVTGERIKVVRAEPGCLELSPALRWLECVERLFAAARDGRTDERGTPEPALMRALLREFAAELAPPPQRSGA